MWKAVGRMGDSIKVNSTASLGGFLRRIQASWDERRSSLDQRGTGARGWAPRNRHDLVVSVVWCVIILGAFAVVGALTTLADDPDVRVWEAWTWSVTSAASSLATLWVPWLATRRATPGRDGWFRLVVVHTLGGFTFAVLHVAGFVAIRNLVYAAMGDDYGLSPLLENFPYELRKDLLTYAATVVLFWVAGQLQAGAAPARRTTSFDIHDGSRIVRTRLDAILAVRSAGNYVEFVLQDGRHLLMRSTLAAIERDLAGSDLIRTHRSWIVNAARVTELHPNGSGDWTLTVGDIRAPASRRFGTALSRLKSAAN